MNNDFKQKLQEREFLALRDSHRVLLKWATGCGKSKMTIDLINYNVDPLVSGKFKHRVLFVVAERAHIKNWEDEFDKWHLKRNNVCTDVCCYASLKKYVDYGSYDFLILDECHHVFSEKRMAALEGVKNNLMPNSHVYLLSATLSRSKQDMVEEMLGKFDVSTVTLKDAINNDILPDPKVYVIGMDLNDKRVDQTFVARGGVNPIVVNWEDRNKYKFKNVPYSIRCTEQQRYIWYNNEMEYWKNRYEHSHNDFHHNLWVNLGSRRKRYLGELKTAAVHKLLGIIPKDKRFVCFCASVNQAEILCAKDTISSRKSAKHNQMIIDAFNAERTSQIFAVGMITEGMNLTGIQVGIITQLDGKERLFLQKVGRVLRADSPVVCIFYYRNTQDENYLKGALENIDAEYIQHIDINQLNTIKL